MRRITSRSRQPISHNIEPINRGEIVNHTQCPKIQIKPQRQRQLLVVKYPRLQINTRVRTRQANSRNSRTRHNPRTRHNVIQINRYTPTSPNRHHDRLSIKGIRSTHYIRQLRRTRVRVTIRHYHPSDESRDSAVETTKNYRRGAPLPPLTNPTVPHAGECGAPPE